MAVNNRYCCLCFLAPIFQLHFYLEYCGKVDVNGFNVFLEFLYSFLKSALRYNSPTVQFTYLKCPIQCFLYIHRVVYSSPQPILSILLIKKFLEILSISKERTLSFSSLQVSHLPQPQANTHLLSVSIGLSFLTLHINGLI